MTDEERAFLIRCRETDPKEKKELIRSLNDMMEMDTEGVYREFNDQLTGSGLLMKAFIKLLRKRGEKNEGIS